MLGVEQGAAWTVEVGLNKGGEAAAQRFVDTALVAHAGGTAAADIGGQADHIPMRVDEEVREAEVVAGHTVVLGTDRGERPEFDQPEPPVVEVAVILKAQAAESVRYAKIGGSHTR